MSNQASTVSRRGFFRRAGAAATAAAPWVISSNLLAGTPPSDRITLGAIGVGRQGFNVNLQTFLQFPDVRVVALCDVDSSRLEHARQAVNEHYGQADSDGVDTYADYRRVLARDDIDAVMISTPDHWHVPMALAAVRAGKDVCCEKPLTLFLEEGRRLSDTVDRYGAVFRTDSEFRSIDTFHRACELVRNGRLGRLQEIDVGVPKRPRTCPPRPPQPVPEELDYQRWLGPAPRAPYHEARVHPQDGHGTPGWTRVRDYCEGVISNWGAHLIDIAQWGNDTDRTGPVEVEATGTYPQDGLWDVLLDFEAEYRYASGVRMHYTINYPHVRFIGEDGWVEAAYGSDRLEAEPASLLNERIRPGEEHLRFKDEKRDFIDCVKTRGRTLEDAEVGHRTTSVCQLAHISIQAGEKHLKWDPDAERFTNSAAANRLTRTPARRMEYL